MLSLVKWFPGAEDSIQVRIYAAHKLMRDGNPFKNTLK